LETPLPGYEETILLNTWRAQLEVLGLDGYPETAHTSNIVCPEVKIKISIRLPPTLEHGTAVDIVENELFKDPPYKCEIKRLSDPQSDNGFDSPLNGPELTNVF
jgi:hypothetical protein